MCCAIAYAATGASFTLFHCAMDGTTRAHVLAGGSIEAYGVALIAKIPIYRHIIENDAEPAELSSPGIIGIGFTSSTFELLPRGP